ncbi:alpha/beta hydrolase [Aquimarina sp. MMG016]|uniref:alpha/beta hydrolase n=1 Tax=Aquimarina sp. MMG016 TaxID=2822690 RepID=UPI001B3A601F|nr:alpha/beta hydrolase [Aquimarina sp. MMG016]MBQ4819118.1 alpha/beta hydrolase [Aquimarina sp. MMG016]
MHKLKKILFYAIILYGLIALFLYMFQEKILFQPEDLPANYKFQFDHTFEEFFIETDDDARLNAIHFKNKNPKDVILYFHGNKGNLKRWGRITSFFANKQYDVIVMDYRGYGKSKGTISESNLYSDAQLFYEYTLKHYSEDQIVLYGRSLGTGLATKVASENSPRHLILETPYYNMTDVVQRWLPVFPINYVLNYKFPSDEFIQKVKCQITIYHGTIDGVVAYKSGKRLFKSIPIPNKEMITVEGGSHNDLIKFDEYLNTIDAVLGK